MLYVLQLILIFSSLLANVNAQDKAPGEVFEVDIPIGEMCHEEMQRQEQDSNVPSGQSCFVNAVSPLSQLSLEMNKISPSVDFNWSKQQTCSAIKELAHNKTEPFELLKKDSDGNTWKIRFHFGFTRTSYADTDMHLKNSRMDVVIKDFSFDERTTADAYDFRKWNKFEHFFQWIDEPTNTFAFSLEKDKNVFYLTAFHPKFLKSKFQDKHVTGVVDGVAVDQVMPINEIFDGYNNQPGQMHLTRFENTHKQMDWQIGYGRKMVVFDTPKAGKLSYIPRVDVGLTSGKNRTVYVKEGQYWEYDEIEDKHRIQGANLSIGHRVEYERGKVGLFVDQKVTASKLHHGSLDGTASYNMLYSPVTFGLSFQIYQKKQ
jgi:hypothetical protein